ncbi:ribbon-helix-helix domain-containing protein [bacterium]|nr:ribbon-helix-helix domain-containing protein [bacterium]
MSGRSKHEVVTFKVDEALLDALAAVPNRSEFIRNAVLAALENTCPLCGGKGVLTEDQQRHWHEFRAAHAIVRCDDCREMRLVCEHEGDEAADPDVL